MKEIFLEKENLNNNITSIIDDYLENVEYQPPLEELTDYCLLILENIYEKQFIKKNIYPEILKQFICFNSQDIYGVNYNFFKNIDNSPIVNELRNIPLIEQRSEEWFKLKEDTIGASEAAAIFGKSSFSSKNELLIRKCGYKKENNSNMMIACMHGTKFEPVVQLLYETINNVELFEFGSIPHPELHMVSASPDGITPEGVMIEIKVPIKRHITGIPPIYYWIQMQQQMQVCNLDRVDFVECKITEYLNKNDFLKDRKNNSDINDLFTENDNYKNAIIEYHNMTNDTISWLYPSKFLKIDELSIWEKKEISFLNKSSDRLYSRTIYWKIELYSITPIWRDNFWWEKNKNSYIDFWNQVVLYREKGYSELINTNVKKISKKTDNKIKCLITDD